jgi:hypothetical protein
VQPGEVDVRAALEETAAGRAWDLRTRVDPTRSARLPIHYPNSRDFPVNAGKAPYAPSAKKPSVCRDIHGESALHVPLAMQKVEGSNPFSRFREGLRLQVFFMGAVGWCVCIDGHPDSFGRRPSEAGSHHLGVGPIYSAASGVGNSRPLRFDPCIRVSRLQRRAYRVEAGLIASDEIRRFANRSRSSNVAARPSSAHLSAAGSWEACPGGSTVRRSIFTVSSSTRRSFAGVSVSLSFVPRSSPTPAQGARSFGRAPRTSPPRPCICAKDSGSLRRWWQTPGFTSPASRNSWVNPRAG